jgi:hypothetical protein
MLFSCFFLTAYYQNVSDGTLTRTFVSGYTAYDPYVGWAWLCSILFYTPVYFLVLWVIRTAILKSDEVNQKAVRRNINKAVFCFVGFFALSLLYGVLAPFLRKDELFIAAINLALQALSYSFAGIAFLSYNKPQKRKERINR